ncbi:MAG: hypothetical protein H6740_02860 [Alphaproteobacteria bacterium]|nr:hypothetical protein [Alphaproteobacteria bacterium]
MLSLRVAGVTQVAPARLGADLRLGLAMLAAGVKAGEAAERELVQRLLDLPAVRASLTTRHGSAPEQSELDLVVYVAAREPVRAALPYLYLPSLGLHAYTGLRRPGRVEALYRLQAWWGQRSVRQQRWTTWAMLGLLLLSGTSGWRRLDLITLGMLPILPDPPEHPAPAEDPVRILRVAAEVEGESELTDQCALAAALRSCAATGARVIALHSDRSAPGPGFAALTLAIAELKADGVEVITGSSTCPTLWQLRAQEPEAWCGLPEEDRVDLAPLLAAERETLVALGPHWSEPSHHVDWYEPGGERSWAAMPLDIELPGPGLCGTRPSLGATMARIRAERRGAPLAGELTDERPRRSVRWTFVDVPLGFRTRWDPETQSWDTTARPPTLEGDQVAQLCWPGASVILTPESELSHPKPVPVTSRVKKTIDVPRPRLQQATVMSLEGPSGVVPFDIAMARNWTYPRPRAPLLWVSHLVHAAHILFGVFLWWALPRRRPILLAMTLATLNLAWVRLCVTLFSVQPPHAVLGVLWLLLALVERRQRRLL